MKSGSGTAFSLFMSHLSRDNFGQFGRIDTSNPDRRAVDPISAKGAGELFVTHFFVGHKAFAFGADALPLNDFFTGIAGAHRHSPFFEQDRQFSPPTRAFSYTLKHQGERPRKRRFGAPEVLPSGNIFDKLPHLSALFEGVAAGRRGIS